MVRDFTVATKIKLYKYIEEDRKKNESRILGGIVDELADLFHYSDLNIQDYVYYLDSYHKKLIDKTDMSEQQITRLFMDVETVDSETAGKLDALKEQLKAYEEALRSLNSVITTDKSASPKDNILLSNALFNRKIGAVDKSIQNYYDKRYKKVGSDGSVEYNWEEIARTLDKDAGDITDMEYNVLAGYFAEMNDEDASRFLQLLAEPKKDLKYEYDLSKVSVWEYDTEKIVKLQFYLGFAATLLDPYGDYRMGMMESFSKDEQDKIGDLWNKLHSQLVQKVAILDLCNTFTETAFSKDETLKMLNKTYEHSDITGEPNADGPAISIMTNTDKSVSVKICNSRRDFYIGASGNGIVDDYQNVNTITLSFPASTGIPGRINDGIYEHMVNVFSLGSSYETKEALYGVTVGTAEIARDKILEKAFEEAFGIGSEVLIPFIMIPADVIISIDKEKRESEERLSELEINHDNMSSALFIDTFGMKGVIATDENSNTVLYCYPTGTTERRLKALNEALEKKGLSGKLKFEYPITLDSLQRDSKLINEIIKDKTVLSDYERKTIFNID